MVTKSPFDLVRERRLEKQIEDMLFCYPYLVDESLLLLQRQVWLARDSRADLQCELMDGSIVIIEVKRGPIKLTAVEQLLRYRKHLHSEGRKFSGYLIGTRLTDDAAHKLKRYKDIAFRQLGKDIPTDIVICHQCRRARDSHWDKCPHDGSRRVLT